MWIAPALTPRLPLSVIKFVPVIRVVVKVKVSPAPRVETPGASKETNIRGKSSHR